MSNKDFIVLDIQQTMAKLNLLPALPDNGSVFSDQICDTTIETSYISFLDIIVDIIVHYISELKHQNMLVHFI